MTQQMFSLEEQSAQIPQINMILKSILKETRDKVANVVSNDLKVNVPHGNWDCGCMHSVLNNVMSRTRRIIINKLR